MSITYPTSSPAWNTPVTLTLEFGTQIIRGQDGAEQRWMTHAGRASWTLPYNHITLAERDALLAVFESAKGSFDQTVSLTFLGTTYTGLYFDTDELEFTEATNKTWTGVVKLCTVVRTAETTAVPSDFPTLSTGAKLQLPYRYSRRFDTVAMQTEGGRVAYANQGYSARKWSVGGTVLTDAEASAIWNCFSYAQGMYRSFGFTDPDSAARYATCRFGSDKLEWRVLGAGQNAIQTTVQQVPLGTSASPVTAEITSSAITTWSAATNGADITVEAIGAGGGGATGGGTNVGVGGGGGAYARKVVPYASGTTITGIQIGVGGTAGVAGTDTKWNTSVVVAKGGGGGVTTTPGAGGAAASCTPTTGAFSGGAGGTRGSNSTGGAGGGGSAGPNGDGKAGGNGGGSGTGGGGGGAGGGSSTAGVAASGVSGAGGIAQDGTAGGIAGVGTTPPGNGSHGSGGGAGTPTDTHVDGADGGNGIEWGTSGGGGGGGGGSKQTGKGGRGGNYGGGGGGGAWPSGTGGTGGGGVIKITYVPA